ncbi:MAG: hypothetical protein GXX96_02930 [Planctomycetaceae bacterium]|nr:hypothetical protein [Planctomycetaceae bacterium]
MKVAVLSESSADKAAVRVFIEALLGRPTEKPGMPPFRARGWPSVRESIPQTLMHLHYQTDAEALVVVVDSDRSPLHDPKSQQRSACNQECRLCLLSRIAENTHAQLRRRPDRSPPRIAIGVAVPQIEAWYLVGRDPSVSEASWLNAVREGRTPYDSRQLKQRVYATDRPSIDLETARAVEESRRIVENDLLDRLISLFPVGFGTLAQTVKNW